MKKGQNNFRFFLMILIGSVFFIAGACKKHYKIPEVTTAAVSLISAHEAISGGSITSDGGAVVYHKGVCWSTSSPPTIDNNITWDGTKTGTFTSYIEGLEANTTYYVCAYATSNEGTGYGSVLSFTTPDYPVHDIDGNKYDTIIIGSQIWLTRNLAVSRYRNGDPVPNITDSAQWVNLFSGAYGNYNNDNNMAPVYGRLYNWYAVTDPRNLAPEGWHVASESEWFTLINYLEDNSVCGGKLKEAGMSHWHDPNTGATNSSGFTALPGGIRSDNSLYYNLNLYGGWWVPEEHNVPSAFNFNLFHDSDTIKEYFFSKKVGLSVRCIKD